MKAKFVNEFMHFERSNDPLVTLQVGRRVQIIKWLDTYEITNYVINDDLTIDVNDDVELNNKNLTKFPDFIKFNNVSGWFACSNNQLTSLVGCPSSVGYSFYCSFNQLTSLVGCPSSVDSNFWCRNNKVQFSEKDVKKLCKVKNDIRV